MSNTFVSIEDWKCPCGTCNTDDGYADWSNECLQEFEKQKNESNDKL